MVYKKIKIVNFIQNYAIKMYLNITLKILIERLDSNTSYIFDKKYDKIHFYIYHIFLSKKKETNKIYLNLSFFLSFIKNFHFLTKFIFHFFYIKNTGLYKHLIALRFERLHQVYAIHIDFFSTRLNDCSIPS